MKPERSDSFGNCVIFKRFQGQITSSIADRKCNKKDFMTMEQVEAMIWRTWRKDVTPAQPV